MTNTVQAFGEVHVGDVGTRYRVKVTDDGEPFDPSDAQVAQFKFRVPGGTVVVRDADAIVPEGSPPEYWFLEYTVKPDDGLGSPPGTFHHGTGPMRVQIYLEWSDGSQFHSSIASVDDRGRDLKIYRNLD